MVNTDLIRFLYVQIPGVVLLQRLGTTVLTIAFFILIGRELYRLAVQGRCDVLTPIIRVGFGFAMLRLLPSIGATAAGVADGLGSEMADVNALILFREAYAHAVGHTAEYSTTQMLASFFSPKAWISILSVFLYLIMMVTKFFVIDVLWPVYFGLVLALGAVAIPIGILPGFTVTGWFKNLFEVSLWPIIFQLLLGLMVGSFAGLLAEVRTLDLAEVFVAPIALGVPSAGVAMPGLVVLLKWWALCGAYIFLSLLTPFIAMMVTRSTPAGVLAGVVAAKVASMAMSGLGRVAATGLGSKFAAGAGGSFTGGGGGPGFDATGAGALFGRGASTSPSSRPTAATSLDARDRGTVGLSSTPSSKTSASTHDERGARRTAEPRPRGPKKDRAQDSLHKDVSNASGDDRRGSKS